MRTPVELETYAEWKGTDMAAQSDSGRRAPMRLRPLATFLVVLSSLCLAISGVVMFYRPAALMTPLTYRGAWKDLHLVMSLVMILSAGLHLTFNWKVFTGYLSRGVGMSRSKLREMAIATGLLAVLAAGSLGGWCRLSSLGPQRHPGGPGGAGGMGAPTWVESGRTGAPAGSLPESTSVRD